MCWEPDRVLQDIHSPGRDNGVSSSILVFVPAVSCPDLELARQAVRLKLVVEFLNLVQKSLGGETG